MLTIGRYSLSLHSEKAAGGLLPAHVFSGAVFTGVSRIPSLSSVVGPALCSDHTQRPFVTSPYLGSAP